MLKTIVLTLSLLVVAPAVHSQQLNFEPCYAFWKLTDRLREGVKLTAEDWQQVKETDGYKRVNKAAWNQFVQQVTLVYSPGNQECIQQEMKKDRSLQRIIRYEKEEARLKNYIATIDQLHLMDSAMGYTKRMLPQKWKNCFPAPKVDFILYNYDGSAREYGITMDLLMSCDMETYRPGAFLGHELLHYALFYCRIKLRHFKVVPQEQQAAFGAINGISEEGIADLIDKPFVLFDEQSPYREKEAFLSLYQTQSSVCIAKLNQAFEQLADQAREPYTSFSYWNSIVLATGHVPGMYMGRLIQQQGLTDELIQHIDNPFVFFYLYNKAARKAANGSPEFSQKALRFLKSMEKRHY